MVTHPNMFWSPLISLCLLAIASSGCGEGYVCVSVLNVLWVIDHLVGHGGKHKLRDKGLERP